ncbi:PKHD1 like 1, tandem duplicate 2 isoform 1 precursor [Danio rerio]|uniref:PKHD1 like 1, tandem duplicate 2 isoform 1 precursor n=1 Tax=Danio rerio TaxID=7955 RepID=A8E7R5_DANRE|nr:PKHD1 like 1, tandem duplicate 2 isoform 1 precursor [Danio rerio]|eukprot:NP_001123871.1 fibrocystin-L isoform 1 precursor [Danio rerio]
MRHLRLQLHLTLTVCILLSSAGFAQASQFNLNANDPNLGNKVTLVSTTRSITCDVDRDSSNSKQIMCYTRALPEDSYGVRVSVDGVPIPFSSICNGNTWDYWCIFYSRSFRTPTIQSISPLSGPPGTVVTMRGRIFTNVYGSMSTSSNGLDVKLSRAYMGGMPCEFLKPNSEEKYGLKLDNGEWGYMSCKMTGTYIGHHNFSYIVSGEYGRSLPDFGVFSISALNKLAMFQTYAEVTGVSPSAGSMLGGTLLTIQGQNFDETDQPAMVLVGGHECQIRSISNKKVVCVTPGYERKNVTVFPGGRGIKMETWDISNLNNLEDVLMYSSNMSGYSVQWVDSLSYVWPNGFHSFVARLSGFFAPLESDNYYFRIKSVGRSQLYFSKTGLPQDKVMIASQPYYYYYTSFYGLSSQKSEVMRLEKLKPYYIEVLVHGYSGSASVDVGFFKEISPFTAQQAVEAVNEKQQINAYYDVLPEKQVVHFKGWKPTSAIREVQILRISSACFSLNTCELTYYQLAYGNLTTGPILVSASAMDLQNALNDLWTIKPDNVTVTKQELDTESVYNVTFNSKRGDFEDLDYQIIDTDLNITVTEAVKGRASMETFTLLWAGVSSLPLPFNASEAEVYSALDLMITAKCPAEIPSSENSNVKFFRDYETASTGLCLAYKGQLRNELGILFSYETADTNREENIRVSVSFDSTEKWNYQCVDLLEYIQAKFEGSKYKLLQLSVYGAADYFIDAVHIGRSALDPYVIVHRRRPPALASSGLFLSNIAVSKQTNASQISYEITATPYNCGFDVPLLEIGFLQKMPNSTVDLLIQSQGNATVTVMRPQKASPPLTGTFDVEVFGRRVEGLTIDISAADLQYALQGIPELGQLQINASNVIGVNPSVTSQEVEKGGLFKQKIMGDFLRVPSNKPQVQVFINGIPSWCSGDCGFTWNDLKTPTVTGISPTEGSSSLGTVLTITGSGFDGGNVTVKTGDVECSILQVTRGTVLTVSGYGFSNNIDVIIGSQPCNIVEVELFQLRCIVPAGSEGDQTVTIGAGEMTAIFNDSFTYSNTLTALITSVSPQTTTVFGDRILTILGMHFGEEPNGSSVLIGDAECELLQWTNDSISCQLPTLPPAVYSVNIRVANQGYPLTSPDINTTIEYVLEVTGFSPSVGSLYGGTTITIIGSGFSLDIQDNTVTLVYGQGYAWSPSALITSVGDTVVWRWDAPAFVPGLGYRVFSVSNPSSTDYDGISFSSGDRQTAKGFFAYRFTSPGVYYYSSGYIDSANEKTLQGVVTVMPLEESTVELQVFVTGIKALVNLGQINSSEPECVATSDCFQDQQEFNDTSDGLYFTFTSCATPTVYDITPGHGTTHDIINIRGSGFSNITCANEVKVGDLPCSVINSSSTEINCQLSPDSGAPVGVPLPITVQINNLGNGLLTMPKEIDRRFVVLPVVDSIFPVVGSTTGSTRLLISGSGFFSGSVMVANIPCNVVSFDYSQIVCDTSPSVARSGDVTVYINSISSSCSSDCTFEYSDSITPQVSTVSPNSVNGNSTTVTVTGRGFGNNSADLMISADNILLAVTEVNDSSIQVLVGALPAGTYNLTVVVMSKGLATGSATLTSIAQASINPTSGSIAGGTPLLITGNGFVAGNTTVKLGNSLCKILDVTADTVRCLTPPRAEGQVQVNIKVFDVVYPPQNFNYSRQQTPNITSVTPKTGPVGTQITISGSGFGTDSAVVSLQIDSVACNISSITDTQLLCTVGEHAGGTFPVMFNHQVKGYALTQSVFKYELLLTGITPNEGSYAGGAVVAIQGSGFDPNITKVLICNRECTVHLQDSTSTQLNCEVPPNNGMYFFFKAARSEALRTCTVMVMNGGDSVNLTSGYTYRSSLTPVITNITPRRGGTAGGTRLTITGSGFSSNFSEIGVTIAGSVCDIQSANETQIICVTNAGPKSQETQVRVQQGNRGIARMDNASFFYIDVWSSPYTWGGLSPPEEGMMVVITAGQTILLDTSTPVLKMLLIQGGRLIFDEADIELQAENILITDGGALQIGTEQMPFQHKAIITLHGHLRSQELPVYGTKTLGVRQGVLDLHGIPVPVPWTRLSQTAQNGSSTLTLMHAVTWKTGDEIVIASTGNRRSQRENELRRIASVSADGRTLTLTEPLTYTHLGVSVTLPDGMIFEARAEVGLLTRNIVVRGSNNAEWNDQIPACPDGFDPGEFATQTCFQGRFGEEVGSDQFGGCIMFHAPQPNQNLAIGRIEYVELFNVGQAFRLERYPIHWHLMGDVHFKSYVRGCSIHQSYNRAVSIHSTHNLLVEQNVIYNIMGGAFFIEDGIETGNILQYNLAVFVKQSTSLQNEDITPAAFWITNPNNTIRHNAVAGGTHFGFWYRMPDDFNDPIYDAYICPKRVPLGQFFNNTVHSQGWFGLWIFQDFFPMETGSCSYSTPTPAVFRRLTSWNNEKGAEWVNVGSVQFSEFLMVNNEKAGVEAKRIIWHYVSGWGLDGGAAVVNSTMVGHVDELGLGSDYCTNRGIVLPLDDGMSVINTTFVNFNRSSCAAVSLAEIAESCSPRCGGWSARFSGIKFYHSPNKAWLRWEHEVALVDIDGSLTGNVSNKVVPKNNLLDPRHCFPATEWSIGIPAAVCDNTINFHRMVIYYPSYTLWAKDVILTNSYVSGRDRVSSRRKRNSVDRSLIDRYLVFNVYQCYYPKCIAPTFTPSPEVSFGPDTLQTPANFTYVFSRWSNTSFWRSSPENNFNVPQEGSDVIIPAYVWMVVDVVVPSLNKLKIAGVLEIPDTNNDTSIMQYNNVVLNATYISIQGGRLIAGWPNEPFRGQLQIILRGSHTTPDWLLPYGTNQGSKVLGVFGSLDLYGMPHNVYHTKLASTSQAGNSTLSLQESVDWKAGDKILLSTTSYDPWQTEIRTIAAVSDYGRTLTLDQPLTYTHIGESYSVPGTSRSYQLAGNVALLTRNIQIIGQEYPDMFTESYGARVLIRNVQFYHTGQEGWNDLSDPRYSLVFLNLGWVAGESYISGCSFHDGFAPAIGIFGTDGLSIDDNVIHHTVGEGISVKGDSNVIQRNLVTLTLWPGSYNGRAEDFNFQWNAAIEVNEATNVTLKGNIVAGYERVGFRIDGEPCPESEAQWSQNEAHGGLYGLYMNRDGLPGCSQIQGFTVWRSFDFGIYVQVSMNVLISNVTLIDNGMGIMSLIYNPPSISHMYADKSVRVQGALIVGNSPNFNCLDSLSTTMTFVSLSRSHRAPRPPSGGRSGVCWPTFESYHNSGPQNLLTGLTSYSAIAGLMTISDTTFIGFQNVCSTERNYMFMTNPGNEDLQHPISVERITMINSTEDSLAFIHRPDLSKVNPSDCVDMDCDAKKKTMLKDLDGSFLGAVGAVVPQSEYEWNGNPRHGLGDYRIPKVMLTYLNGSRIPVNQISPYKGVIRSNCTYMSTWQSYKCFGLNYKMLVIESLDTDTETRRLSPVAILGDKYVDLINGPQDHSWCSGYTCRKRISLFHAIVATNKSFDIYFTSTTPQKLRLMLLNAGPTESVRVAVFYSNPQRLDVYVNNSLVGPTNAQWNVDKTDYTLLEPTYTGQYFPSFNASHGSNFLDQDYKMMNILLRGSDPVQIRTSPVLFVAFNLPAMTEAEFFGPNLINNLAAFLKIPPYKIRITKIIREGTNARRRRSTGLTVQVEIREPPAQTTTNSTTDNTQQFDVLKNIADDLGRAAVSGNLSQSIGFNVSSMGIIPPPPSSSDPAWNNVATQEVTRADQQVETVKTVSSLKVVVQPQAGSSLGPLSVQPSIMALDSAGDCVSVGVTSLTLSAVLKDANGNLVNGLYGNTTIPFSVCWANYTDLAINTSCGSCQNLKLVFTLTQWNAESRSFTLRSPTTPSSVGNGFPNIFGSSPAISTMSVYLLILFSALLLLLQCYE